VKKSKFKLKDKVKITISGEEGTVIGRAQYIHDGNGYLIRYLSVSTGKERWWSEDALRKMRKVKK